jgi:CRP/FNR family transcriptional regulator
MATDQSKQVKTALAQIRHFSGLPDNILDEIATAAILRRLNAGNVIYLEGEPAEAVYILTSGWVKATRMTRAGREQALMVLRPVEIFGDVSVVTRQPFPATVTALEPVRLWVIPAQTLMQLVNGHPALALAVIRRLGERVLYYAGLVEDISLRSVEARLASTLLHYAADQEGQLVVPRRAWATFDEMAVRLGTVRDVLSRALKTLESEGLLRVEKQAIILLDVRGLAERGDI